MEALGTPEARGAVVIESIWSWCRWIKQERAG